MLAECTFPAGPIGPKVDAGCSFVSRSGGFATIGALEEIAAILKGQAGTRIDNFGKDAGDQLTCTDLSARYRKNK